MGLQTDFETVRVSDKDDAHRRAALSGFHSGTLILTDQGLRRVERLRPGVRVITAAGAALPVIWKAVTRLVDAPISARPIRLDASRLRAVRTLRVAPATRVVVDKCDPGLVPASWLADGAVANVRVALGRAHVVYHHILLPYHAVIFAEGVQVESFYPSPDALNALDQDARAALSLILPGAHDIGLSRDARSVYGPTAHGMLEPRDLRLIAADGDMLAPPAPSKPVQDLLAA